MSARTKFRYGKDHMEEAYYADFFRDCESDGWIVAMDRLTSRPDIIKPQKISEFLSNQKRNDFVFLLPIGPGGSALDYGSGYGNTSFTLSHYCERVVAVEADRQRLRFSAAHFSHAGARNILPMAGGGSTSLPFEDESFDTVVLNGVLEWTATTIEGHPRDVHLSLLKEIRRVLRPSGSVAISIENRYSYKWFTGIRDHHAGGLRWVSFLPRRLADIYSRVRLRRPYRTWFYSYRALIRLLSEA
ncbi:MAG: class I SAM-dependent methyltransferase, partial [Rickettsiales bacterium]